MQKHGRVKMTAVVWMGVLALLGCATTDPHPRPNPYIMEEKTGIFLNTFSLGQGDFPVLGGLEDMPAPPAVIMLDEAKVRSRLFGAFSRHDITLKPDYPFNYGRVHVNLDGYDPQRLVGYLYISKDDYELPKPSPPGKPPSTGLYYTQPDPARVSMPELIVLEQLNGQERCYIALINAHQFALPVDATEIETEAMFKRLDARIDLYLSWVDARHAKRRQQGVVEREK